MPDAKSTPTLTVAQRERRERIVDAGLALLAERDYEKIQVKDVAEEANVALGTLYHYFSSKEHLFAEVLVRWAGTLRTNISRNPLRGANRRAAPDPGDQPLGAGPFSASRRWRGSSPRSRPPPTPWPRRSWPAWRTRRTTSTSRRSMMSTATRRNASSRSSTRCSRPGLRSWVAGRISITAVSDDLADAIALLLDPETGRVAAGQIARS